MTLKEQTKQEEHNPDSCSICQELGDYSEQPDLFGHNWFEAHRAAGINLNIKIRFGLPEGAFTYVTD